MGQFVIASDVHLHNWSAFAKVSRDGINTRLLQTAKELVNAASQAEGGRLYLAGDLVHVRGSMATEVANVMAWVFQRIKTFGVEVRAIPGNHDLASRTPNWISSVLSTLEDVGVTCVNQPTYFSDDNVLMIPWIEGTPALRQTLINQVESHPGADVIMHGHLNGVIKGIPNTGLDPSEIGRVGFKRIFSGHLHNHVDFGNGTYSIGALTHQTWSDVGTRSGFLIIDDDTVTHIADAAPKFVDYDPNDLSSLKGNYVRARVELNTSAEAEEYRRYLCEQGALDAIVHPILKDSHGREGSTVDAGASIEHSLHEWIGKRQYNNPEALEQRCTEILAEVG